MATIDYTKLLEMKERIEKGKTKIAELMGQKKNYLEQLQRDYNCADVEQAKALLEQLETQLEALESKIQSGIVNLQEKYPQLIK